ncbi:MAG: YdbH domain-containing protein [Gammaproteobacteria bacterium]|nr:YdbH domain-containing protein [Gammaproteobacteria bacterium]
MSTRIKGILAALIIIAGILAAGYAAAPALVAAIAVRSLDGVVEVRELDIESVGLSRIEIATVSAANPQMTFGARGATVRFDPWPFRIHHVAVREARLEIAESAPGGEPGAAPALPPFPIRVDALSLHTATPWGELAVPVSIDTRPGAAGGLEGEVQSPEFTVSLSNPESNRHALELLDSGGASLLSLSVRHGTGYPIGFNGRFEPELLARWLPGSPVGLPGLQPELAKYSLSGATVMVSGVVEENLDFVAELRGKLTLNDVRGPADRLFDVIELDMDPVYTITRSGAAWSGSGEAGFGFALNPETRLTGRNPGWRWSEDGLSISAAGARLDPLALEADSVELSAPAFTAAAANGEFHAWGARLPGWPENLPHYDLSGNWTWESPSLEVRGTGGGTGVPQLAWRLQAGGARGNVEIDLADTLASIEPFLGTYASAVAPDLEVLAGRLEGRYHTEWNGDRIQTSLAVRAGPVDADLGGMEIRGLDVRVDNRSNRVDRLVVALAAPTLKLAAGTVAEDLEMDMRLDPQEIHVDAARMSLFGGRIGVRPFSFTPEDDEVVVFADVDALSLEQVMALMELETTQLTGDVAGPVRFIYNTDRGIEINKGDLHSVHTGVLKFRMNQDSSTATQLDNLALRALEDFQYDELSASLVYKPDGEYRITARILGRNPEVLDGHPIALNPTIEGRLPALFRAFFITGDFNQAIIRRLQEERGMSTPGETPTLQKD